MTMSKSYPTQKQMENNMMSKPDMSGRKDLGIRRLPKSSAIPVQSKGPTKTSNGMTHDKTMKAKMKKVMLAKGMIKEC
jgi:hypothetical protein